MSGLRSESEVGLGVWLGVAVGVGVGPPVGVGVAGGTVTVFDALASPHLVGDGEHDRVGARRRKGVRGGHLSADSGLPVAEVIVVPGDGADAAVGR